MVIKLARTTVQKLCGESRTAIVNAIESATSKVNIFHLIFYNKHLLL